MSIQSWMPGSIGAWTVSAGWGLNPPPGASDTALILQGDDLINVSGSVAVSSMTLSDAGAVLDVTGVLDVADGLMVTAGEIAVSGYLDTGDLINAGTILNSGFVVIGGNVSASSLAGILGGSVSVAGTLDNQGWTLGSVQAAQLGDNDWGVVLGGTLANVSIAGMATLDAVAVAGTLGIQGIVNVAQGLSAADVSLTGGDLVFASVTTLSGTISGAGTIATANTLVIAQGAEVNDGFAVLLNDSILHLAGGTIINQGTITGVDDSSQIGVGNYAPWLLGGVDYQSADFTNQGLVGLANDTIATTVFFNMDGGTLALDQPGGRLTVAAATRFTNDGLITGGGGTIDIEALVSGTGTIEVDQGDTVRLDNAVMAGQVIRFAGDGVLALGSPRFVKAEIDGFGVGDTILLSGSMAGVRASDGDLTLVGNGLTVDLDIAGAPDLSRFLIAANAGETMIEAASQVSCFVEGTRIAVPDGEDRAVEELTAGDLIMTASGTARPIVWVGRRMVDCARHPAQRSVWPVRIAAHAFAEGVPARDLCLSPDHGVLAGDALMRIGHLCNGLTIVQEKVETVTYYHIELETHDVLLAEGLAAETYLDTDGRANFETAGAVVRLHPDFGSGSADVAAIWEMFGCAPLVVAGPRLDQERRRLAARAVALNPACGHERQASAG